MKLAYPAVITYDAEDKSYSVAFPDLKGCVSGGFSLIEAIEMGIDAASGWILKEMEEGKSRHETWRDKEEKKNASWEI